MFLNILLYKYKLNYEIILVKSNLFLSSDKESEETLRFLYTN